MALGACYTAVIDSDVALNRRIQNSLASLNCILLAFIFIWQLVLRTQNSAPMCH